MSKLTRYSSLEETYSNCSFCLNLFDSSYWEVATSDKEWMHFAGHDQSALASEAGIGFVARKASCEYLRPARLDDQLTVGLEVEKLTRVRVVFRQHLRRGDDELVTGTVEIACVDMATMKTAPIPDFLYAKLEALK